LSPAVLRSWFPESTGAGAPGRGRRNQRGAGAGGGGGGGQRQDGNRGQPDQRADNFGNVAPQGPSHHSGSPGNSVHEGPPRGPRNNNPNNRFRKKGPPRGPR
jgi:hypothetical protein